MRIAIVTRGDLYPTHHGAAVKIVRTAEYLSLLGATVCVVTDDRDHYLRYSQGRVESVAYGARFRATQEWPGMTRAGRLAEQICAKVGYPQEETFLYRAQFDPAWWARVLYVGRTEQIQVYQAEFPGYGMACWMAAKVLGGKSVIVQHNVEWDRLRDVSGLSAEEIRHIRRLERLALKRVDEVIAVSSDDADRMEDAGIARDSITVIPHGVDTCSYVNPRSQQIRFVHGLPQDAPLLFFHGTLHYWPNTQAVRFIAEELLPRLLPHHPDLHVLIAGMNPPSYYRHERIVFPGPVDDVAACCGAADLAVCPIPSGGGTRMKLLEYFAAGLPCVSTTKGAEGISFTPGREIALADDPESFAAEVLRLLADDQAREDMGRAARDFAAWYDWGAIAQGYLDLFQGQGRGANYNHTVTRAIDQGQSPAPPLQRLVAEKDPLFSHLPPRVPSKPLTMLLLVNRGCNLRCSFCDLWDKPEELAFDKAVALLDEAVAIGTRTLVITGGEPFLYKRLFDLVGEAKARGMGVNITTNGTLIEKRWEALVSSGVDSVSVSIDGTSSTHDHLRGQEGCHKRTLKGLTRLKEDGRVGLSIYFVVTRENVRELPEVFALSQSLDIGFDFWPVNDERSHYLESEEDREAYRQSVATIASARPEVAARRAFYEEGLVYHNGGLGPVRCLGLVDQYGVTYTGDLLPCCVWGGEDLVVGNVFETPLSELWRSPEVQSHRHSLYGEGCSAGCFNHSLYEFTQSTGESFRVPQGEATS